HLLELAGPRLRVRWEVGVADDAELPAMGEEGAGVAGPVVELGGSSERRDAPDPVVLGGDAQGHGAAGAGAGHPDAADTRQVDSVVDDGRQVVEPALEGEVALGVARAAE